MKRLLFAALLLFRMTGTAFSQQAMTPIPDLCAGATVTSKKDGRWNDPSTWTGNVPGATDRVAVLNAVTVDADFPALPTCIGVKGSLAIANAPSYGAGTTVVYPGGAWVWGSSSAPGAGLYTIRNLPTNQATDPEAYGTGIISYGTLHWYGQPRTPTFSRLTVEPKTGQTTLALTDVTNWKPGDRLVLPDTRQRVSSDFGPPTIYDSLQIETPIVQSASGTTVTLTAPLATDHLGARDLDGTLTFLPHIGNLSRSIIIKSESPTGTRGHVLATGRADVDIRYVDFEDLGRTLWNPDNDSTTFDAQGHVTHIGTNQVGRYALHLHHLYGPSPAVNPRQFTLIGNVVQRTPKWGIAVHDSSYGQISDNLVYDSHGAAMAFEDGSETENIVDHNFLVKGTGTGGRQDFGREGDGIWMHGPLNHIRNNVAANFYAPVLAGYGYSYFLYYTGNINVPNGPGSDTTMPGQYTTQSAHGVPLKEFSNNESYANYSGMTFWWIGTESNVQIHPATPESVIAGFKGWHLAYLGIFGYECYHVTIDSLVLREELSPADTNREGIFFGDYQAANLLVTNPDIQGFNHGIGLSAYSGGAGYTQTIRGGVLRNTVNVFEPALYTSSYNPLGVPPRTVIVDGTTMRHVNANTIDILPNYQNWAVVTLIRPDTFVVKNYNGVSGDNFNVYRLQQDPNFVLPQSEKSAYDNTPDIEGSPELGLTNAQNWAKYGITFAGALAPCSTTRAGITGFACGGVPPPPAPVPPDAATSPVPADKATGVLTTATLGWGSVNATAYDVFFGTNATPPLVSSNQAALTYAPTLALGTTYYWSVTSKNATASTPGPTWSFSTIAAPPPPPVIPPPPTSFKGDIVVAVPFTWDAMPGASWYELRIYEGTTVVNDQAHLTTTSAVPVNLLHGHTYSAEVRSCIAAGCSTYVLLTVTP